MQHHAGAGQLHFEAAARSALSRRIGLEVFEVDVVRRARTRGDFHHLVHERRRAAGVDVCLAACALQTGRQRSVEVTRLDAVMELHLAVENLASQQLRERRMLGGTGEIVQAVRMANGVQLVGHGEQRRDADAGGEQHMLARFRSDAEQVARCAHFQFRAFADLLVQGA
ncbi:hypothetical protein D3C81_1565450 [compost metagenome]